MTRIPRTFVVAIYADGTAVLEDSLTDDRAWVQDLGGVLPQVLAWLGGEVHDSDQEVET